MKENNHFEELIVSYLLNELNAEEEEFVLEWINSNEQNKQSFEEIKNTFRLLSLQKHSEDIGLDLEWKKFKEAIGEKQEPGSIKYNESIDKNVLEEHQPARKGTVYKFLISTAIAASVIFLIVLGWRMTDNKTSNEKPLTYPSKNEVGLSPVLTRQEKNNSERARLSILPDGSEVRLSAKSELIFEDPFKDNKRDIKLTGKATFRVAEDKSKPFTVYSGDLSISALGTEFTVSAYQDQDHITVRLYEGKLLVKSSVNAKRKLPESFYLLGGQEFLYNRLTASGKTRTFRSVSKTALDSRKEMTPVENPSVPSLGKGSWFMFNNEPLGQVLEQLKNLYNVDIIYSKKDVSKIYFIGTFNNSDSLEHILNQVTRLNNLKVTKKSNKFIISK